MLILGDNQDIRMAKWKDTSYELIIRTYNPYDGETTHVHRTGIFFDSFDKEEYARLQCKVLFAFAESVIKCRE